MQATDCDGHDLRHESTRDRERDSDEAYVDSESSASWNDSKLLIHSTANSWSHTSVLLNTRSIGRRVLYRMLHAYPRHKILIEPFNMNAGGRDELIATQDLCASSLCQQYNQAN